MKEWIVRLRGDQYDLLDLSKMLTSTDLNIMEENNYYYLRCSEFKLLKEANSVYSYATEIIREINLVAKLFISEYNPVKLDIVILVNEDGSRNNFIFLSSKVKMRSRTSIGKLDIISNNNLEIPSQNKELEKYISVVKRDTRVERALKYFVSKDSRWFNLFKVYEVINEDMGGEKRIRERKWATKNKLELFTKTANNLRAIGDEARHGHEKWEPPSNPMSLSEAESLLKTLLINWIDSKC